MKGPLIIYSVDLWKDEDTDQVVCNHENGFILDWQSNKGFGLFTFSRDAQGVYVGDECMGLKNVELALSSYCSLTPAVEWPVLLREFGSAAALMRAVTSWESQP